MANYKWNISLLKLLMPLVSEDGAFSNEDSDSYTCSTKLQDEDGLVPENADACIPETTKTEDAVTDEAVGGSKTTVSEEETDKSDAEQVSKHMCTAVKLC